MRLIDGDALEESMMKSTFGEWMKYCYPCVEVLDAIKAAPTIGERKPGKWSIEFSPAYMGGAYCECSKCNYKFAVGAYFEPNEWKFCPECGSAMTEGAEE